MTDRELRKLKRVELLELLVDQAAEMERLEQQLKELQQELASRKLEQESAGTMAEAALRLNDIFGAADRAAADYLENARRLSEQAASLWEHTQKKCEALEEKTRERCITLLTEAAGTGENTNDEE